MRAEAQTLRTARTSEDRPRLPTLPRRSIGILSGFVVLMSFQNSVLKFQPNPGGSRFNLDEIGYNLGNGFGILFLFWVICKGIAVARGIEIRTNIIYIVFSIIGTFIYTGVFILIVASSRNPLLIIVTFLPLMLAAYFVVGFVIGLVIRAVGSGARESARHPV